MNTFPLETMGLPLPGWASATFHLMFLSGAQVVGALFSADVPLPAGPRHAGQSSAERIPAPRSNAAATPGSFALMSSSVLTPDSNDPPPGSSILPRPSGRRPRAPTAPLPPDRRSRGDRHATRPRAPAEFRSVRPRPSDPTANGTRFPSGNIPARTGGPTGPRPAGP